MGGGGSSLLDQVESVVFGLATDHTTLGLHSESQKVACLHPLVPGGLVYPQDPQSNLGLCFLGLLLAVPAA